MTLFGKILIGVILVTGGFLLVKGMNKSEESTSPETSVAEEQVRAETPSSGAFNGSMTELLARGGNYKCEFTHSTDMNTSSGTIYIASKKMRGDFESTVASANNMKIESHMISDGEFFYSWSSMMPMGFKIKIPAETAQASSELPKSGFDYNQKLDYKCSPWMEDQTMFTLPAAIKFTEAPQP